MLSRTILEDFIIEEGLCEEEARILIAVKDQKLQEMFPILLQLYPERKQTQIP